MVGIGTGPAIAAIVSANLNLSQKKQAILESVELQLQEENLKSSKRICPECGKNFSEITVEGMTIETCVFCKSLWLDLEELKQLTGMLDDIPGIRLADKESKLKCPVCSKSMLRKIFMQRSNLVVDLCREHGIYLENGELTRALELSER